MARRDKQLAKTGSSRAWEELTPPLSQWLTDAMESMGFARMTPVQASAIPLFLGNKDVVVEAVTGSGKTLAFLIPIVEKLLRLDGPTKKHHIAAIIISPTRELATQLHQVLVNLLQFHGPSATHLDIANAGAASLLLPGYSAGSLKDLLVKPQLLLGGNRKPAEDLSIFLRESPNVLIGTPGRLLELLSSPHVHCPQSSFEVLVLDEADRLLDLGFKDDLQKILQRLPKQRRTGLFSASVSEAVDQLIRVGLRNPVRISVRVKSSIGVQDQRTPASLSLTYLETPSRHKLPALSKLARELSPPPQKTVVYVATCATVDYFTSILPLFLPELTIIPLHGKHPPQVRERNFVKFTDSLSSTLLLTTDVAARGLDIPQVDLVVQLDPPTDPKAFLHRCGRAGRAGRKGLAVTFLLPGREQDYIEFLRVRKTPVVPLVNPRISITDHDAEETSKTIRGFVATDRALYDKAQRAFVSWVKAYSKHEASSIFRVPDLRWTDLGHAWGLLKMPKMPELKTWDGDKSLGFDFDFVSFAYKDRAREKHRLDERDAYEAKFAAGYVPQPRKLSSEQNAWSGKQEQRDLREQRRLKRQKRRDATNKASLTTDEAQKQAELARMIAQVRQITAEKELEFEGFGD